MSGDKAQQTHARAVCTNAAASVCVCVQQSRPVVPDELTPLCVCTPAQHQHSAVSHTSHLVPNLGPHGTCTKPTISSQPSAAARHTQCLPNNCLSIRHVLQSYCCDLLPMLGHDSSLLCPQLLHRCRAVLQVVQAVRECAAAGVMPSEKHQQDVVTNLTVSQPADSRNRSNKGQAGGPAQPLSKPHRKLIVH